MRETKWGCWCCLAPASPWWLTNTSLYCLPLICRLIPEFSSLSWWRCKTKPMTGLQSSWFIFITTWPSKHTGMELWLSPLIAGHFQLWAPPENSSLVIPWSLSWGLGTFHSIITLRGSFRRVYHCGCLLAYILSIAIFWCGRSEIVLN